MIYLLYKLFSCFAIANFFLLLQQGTAHFEQKSWIKLAVLLKILFYIDKEK